MRQVSFPRSQRGKCRVTRGDRGARASCSSCTTETIPRPKRPHRLTPFATSPVVTGEAFVFGGMRQDAHKQTLVEQVSKACDSPPAYFFRSSAARLRSAPVFRRTSTRSLAQRGVCVEHPSQILIIIYPSRGSSYTSCRCRRDTDRCARSSCRPRSSSPLPRRERTRHRAKRVRS